MASSKAKSNDGNDYLDFLAALGKGIKDDERLILCGFRGDPDKAPTDAWRPRPYKVGGSFPFDPPDNVYVTVASFGRAYDGTFRRRKELFKGALALMVDDVGTKILDVPRLTAIKPSAIMETSPGNYQYWYFFKEIERDVRRFEGLIRSFILDVCPDATDPGMAGVTRVGRLPGFANDKPKYGGWVVKLTSFNPNRRYTIEEICEALKIRLNIPSRQRLIIKEQATARIESYYTVYEWLSQNKMVKRDDPDMAGWTEIECPWRDEHTNRANTGAAIREPNEENGFNGAYKCHHGHCAKKGWRELTEWINERSVEKLELINMENQHHF